MSKAMMIGGPMHGEFTEDRSGSKYPQFNMAVPTFNRDGYRSIGDPLAEATYRTQTYQRERAALGRKVVEFWRHESLSSETAAAVLLETIADHWQREGARNAKVRAV